MASNLQIEQALDSEVQSVQDQEGHRTSLALSSDKVGVGTTTPSAPLHVFEARGAGGHTLKLDAASHTNPNVNFLINGEAVANIRVHEAGGNELQLQTYSRPGGSVTTAISMTPEGNVGVGTTKPAFQLSLGSSLGRTKLALYETDAGNSYGLGITAGTFRLHLNGHQARFAFLNSDEDNADEVLTVRGNGRVGIGKIHPRETLEVNGNILATGDVRLEGADCAEEFDVAAVSTLTPGTVMVIGDEERLQQSTAAYDKRVAGVLSGAGAYRPGIVLDRQTTTQDPSGQDPSGQDPSGQDPSGQDPSIQPRMPLALSGKVYCKVDAHFGPIAVGDLLTTSPTPGHAMKAADAMQAFGAVIGKALRPLPEGQGLIPILIALQ
ncbi:MAG: hypothetical protein R3C14_26460 [Caldilineaceae bacterium]